MTREHVQIQPSMFPELVPSKLDIVVPYQIVSVCNYRVSADDNGRNIAEVMCLHSWSTKHGTMHCKGKNSVYHYQWMADGNVARCGKCGCKWMYDSRTYNAAHRSLHNGNIESINPEYPLIDTETE